MWINDRNDVQRWSLERYIMCTSLTGGCTSVFWKKDWWFCTLRFQFRKAEIHKHLCYFSASWICVCSPWSNPSTSPCKEGDILHSWKEKGRKNGKTAGGRCLIFTSIGWSRQHLPCILRRRIPGGELACRPRGLQTSPPAHRIPPSIQPGLLHARAKHFTFIPYSSLATWTSPVSVCPPAVAFCGSYGPRQTTRGWNGW